MLLGAFLLGCEPVVVNPTSPEVLQVINEFQEVEPAEIARIERNLHHGHDLDLLSVTGKQNFRGGTQTLLKDKASGDQVVLRQANGSQVQYVIVNQAGIEEPATIFTGSSPQGHPKCYLCGPRWCRRVSCDKTILRIP